jgi:hypothetical protein
MNDTTTTATTSSTMIPPNSPPTLLLWLAYAVAMAEFAAHPIALCISALNLLVLWDSRFLHPNLRFILLCQSLDIVGFEMQRFCVVTMKLFGNDIFFAGPIFFQVFKRFLVYKKIIII